MATTTLGVKLDDATHERLKKAAAQIDRTPHWMIKQAIFNYLEQVESGLTPAEHAGLAAAAGEEALESLTEQGLQVFLPPRAQHPQPPRRRPWRPVRCPQPPHRALRPRRWRLTKRKSARTGCKS